jgi:ABC-type branched-subunit amino acid transport system ATPase component
MANGEIRMEGTGAELLEDADIRATYLEGGHQ